MSLHFLCEEQSYHRASFQHDVTGRLEDESLQKVRHLRVYQTTEAQNLLIEPRPQLLSRPLFSLTFHIFLSYQAEQALTLILSSR